MLPRCALRAALLPRRSPRCPFSTASEHSLARSPLKELIRQGKPAIGALTDMHRDTTHVELLGMLGYDYLWVDCEHSPASPASCEHLYLAAERRGLATITRVGENSIGHIAKYLWSGSQGILIPSCNSAADAQAVVAAVKFPPLGERGLAGDRWCNWNLGGNLADCVAEANDKTVVGVQIETLEGANNLDEILAVAGVDFVFLGPTDLSAAIELPGQIRHPRVLEWMEEMGARILASGKAAGTLILTEEDYAYWRERGFTVNVTVVRKMLVDGMTQTLSTLRKVDTGGDGER